MSPEGDCSKGPHGPIGEWDVSRVGNMYGMFKDAAAFNGDLSKWDVSSVINMNDMFEDAAAFNGVIAKWNVSSVTVMGGMFQNAATFNGDISQWDVSSVTDMGGMFQTAAAFNGDISKWDVSSVTDMSNMFSEAELFNGDISKWDVSSVTMMDRMFFLAASFKQKLCGTAWVDSKASKTLMFAGTSGSISQTVCTSVTRQYVSRPPLTERELIVSTPIIKSVSTPGHGIARTMACPKCGTFEKSGRKSCCAPGGAWYKNCARSGGARSKNVDHKWFEGVAACKRKFNANCILQMHSHSLKQQ